METINFKNKPDTSTPIDAENLNLLQANIQNEFNTAKSIEFSGQWLICTYASGFGMIFNLPIYNPELKPININLNGRIFIEDSWHDIQGFDIQGVFKTFCLVRLNIQQIAEAGKSYLCSFTGSVSVGE